MQVTDRPSADASSLTQAKIVQMVYCQSGNGTIDSHHEFQLLFCDVTGDIVQFSNTT